MASVNPFKLLQPTTMFLNRANGLILVGENSAIWTFWHHAPLCNLHLGARLFSYTSSQEAVVVCVMLWLGIMKTNLIRWATYIISVMQNSQLHYKNSIIVDKHRFIKIKSTFKLAIVVVPIRKTTLVWKANCIILFMQSSQLHFRKVLQMNKDFSKSNSHGNQPQL